MRKTAAAPENDAAQIARLRALFRAQSDAFARQRFRPLESRREDLKKLERAVIAAKDRVAAAASEDFGTRSPAETLLAETAFVADSARHARAKLKKWAKSRRAPVQMTFQPGRAYVRREPKGVAGIISPWNYPLALSLGPLIGALAAGCRALVKPSELAPASAGTLRDVLAETFPEDQVAAIPGGAALAEAFCALPFDHLVYTGSTRVGRLVAQAAAKNLTPVTLELGGKSPAVVAENCPPARVAASLAYGRLMNGGQTCVAPDYVLAPRQSAGALADAVLEKSAEMFPDPAANPDYTAAISRAHYDRLSAMIDEARAAGADIRSAPCDADAARAAKKIPPTVVLNPPPDSRLMTEEIFGPVLPIVSYDSPERALETINRRDKPLALYVFGGGRDFARKILAGATSGGASVNVPFLHMAVHDLPFGGVGASGQGAYHGERGFLTFTHERAVFEAPLWHPLRLTFPPYGKLFRLVAGKMLNG